MSSQGFAPAEDRKPASARLRWAVASALGLSLAFSPVLVALTRMAWHSDLFSYILLIPFASAYLVQVRGTALPRPGSSDWHLGGLAGTLAVLALAHSFVHPHSILSGQVLAYYASLLTIGFIFLGRRWMWATAFPVFLLSFLIPWPKPVVAALEYASQTGSAWVAHRAFELTSMPVFRDGFTFDLAGARIQVAQECSGIRSSVSLFLSGLLAANLLLRTPVRRALLLAVIAPLALLRNGARIWFIAWLCVKYGPQMIHSDYHLRGGPYFFALSLVPLLALLWWLERQENRLPPPTKPPSTAPLHASTFP